MPIMLVPQSITSLITALSIDQDLAQVHNHRGWLVVKLIIASNQYFTFNTFPLSRLHIDLHQLSCCIPPPWPETRAYVRLLFYVVSVCCTSSGKCIPPIMHSVDGKMAAISQTTFSNSFWWMISFVFSFEFHWSVLFIVQLTISQHWFEQ